MTACFERAHDGSHVMMITDVSPGAVIRFGWVGLNLRCDPPGLVTSRAFVTITSDGTPSKASSCAEFFSPVASTANGRVSRQLVNRQVAVPPKASRAAAIRERASTAFLLTGTPTTTPYRPCTRRNRRPRLALYSRSPLAHSGPSSPRSRTLAPTSTQVLQKVAALRGLRERC